MTAWLDPATKRNAEKSGNICVISQRRSSHQPADADSFRAHRSVRGIAALLSSARLFIRASSTLCARQIFHFRSVFYDFAGFRRGNIGSARLKLTLTAAYPLQTQRNIQTMCNFRVAKHVSSVYVPRGRSREPEPRAAHLEERQIQKKRATKLVSFQNIGRSVLEAFYPKVCSTLHMERPWFYLARE